MSVPPMRRPPKPGEHRSPELLWEQYLVEKSLAERLRSAARSERLGLYSSVYDELFRRIPHHSQLTRKASAADAAPAADGPLKLLSRFLRPHTTFLEIGAGDCALSFTVAARVRQVYAVDVSDEITRSAKAPPNFRLVLSDGSSIPAPAGSIDVAYSNQLMEHLHPDDAFTQLRNIYTALRPGGTYICLTPNRLTGPHDISRYFDPIATGLHLKEYTVGELHALFRQVGFRRIQHFVRRRGTYVRVPASIARTIERALTFAPTRISELMKTTPQVRAVLNICLVAQK